MSPATMFPATSRRVSMHTRDEHNERIRQETAARLTRLASASPAEIDKRLRELDHEWDIERVLEANASSLVLLGLGLGAGVDRRFYALPAAVAGFLLQHALQGWCPPITFFRRRGFRTQREIDEERDALKLLRGDYTEVLERNGKAVKAEELLAAVER